MQSKPRNSEFAMSSCNMLKSLSKMQCTTGFSIQHQPSQEFATSSRSGGQICNLSCYGLQTSAICAPSVIQGGNVYGLQRGAHCELFFALMCRTKMSTDCQSAQSVWPFLLNSCTHRNRFFQSRQSLHESCIRQVRNFYFGPCFIYI